MAFLRPYFSSTAYVLTAFFPKQENNLLAYKIKDDIPIMLADEARKLSLDELDSK